MQFNPNQKAENWMMAGFQIQGQHMEIPVQVLASESLKTSFFFPSRAISSHHSNSLTSYKMTDLHLLRQFKSQSLTETSTQAHPAIQASLGP